MTERVRQILSGYESDNPGTRMNLARLLNHGRLGGTGKFVILPVDQGFEHGPARSFAPNPAGYDPDYHFQLAIEAGCNAYAAPLGFIEAGVANFLGEIPLILKLNNHDVLYDEKDPLYAVTYAAQIAAQLGAHIIKVKLPSAHIELGEAKKVYQKHHIPIETLPDRVRHVVQSAFNGKRIVIFSGGPRSEDEAFFTEARAIRDGGGFGSIIGRNSFQRQKSEGLAFLRTVMQIYAGEIQ